MQSLKKRYLWQVTILIVLAILYFAVIMPLVQPILPKSLVGLIAIQEVIAILIFVTLNRLSIKQSIHFRKRVSIKQLLIIAGPLYVVLLMIFGSLTQKHAVDRLPLALVTGIGAGFFEEYLFRGVIMGRLIHIFQGPEKRRQIWLAVFVTSLLFGIMHGVNITNQPLGQTLVQMLFAASLGLLLAVLYLRSGTIILPMLAHGLWDFNAVLLSGNISQSGTVTSSEVASQFVLYVIFFLLTAFYLRKKKLATIDLTIFD